MENSLKKWKKSGKYVFSAQRFIDAEFEQARKNNCTFWLATATPESVIQKYRWILSADGKEVELDSSGFGQIPDPRPDYKGRLLFLSGRDCVDQADFAPYSGPIPPEPAKESRLTNQVYRALKDLGFKEVFEVAHGADVGAATEAHHYATQVATGEVPFLLTSCCPAWSMLAKTQFPEMIDRVSSALTPMVATARSIKQKMPDARVVFIGPCAAKKLEASRRTVRSDVDFVITFEELAAMFEARGIDFKTYNKEDPIHDATGAGRGYAVAGGVAAAVEACVREYYPGVEVKNEHAEGLDACKKILMLAKAGKKNGCLIEGMGCPG